MNIWRVAAKVAIERAVFLGEMERTVENALRASTAMLPKTHPLLLCLGSYQFLYYSYFVRILQNYHCSPSLTNQKSQNYRRLYLDIQLKDRWIVFLLATCLFL